MNVLWLFGHQLTTRAVQHDGPIFMCEATSRALWQSYHKQKLVYIFSAMRHFRDELRRRGKDVIYLTAPSFQAGWSELVQQCDVTHLTLYWPTDKRMRRLLETFLSTVTVEVTIEEEPLFIVKEEEWAQLLPDGKPWRMYRFYETMRRHYNLLMEGNEPLGGSFSFDAQNRKPPTNDLLFTPPLSFPPDDVTQQVIAEVNERFPHHFGSTESFAYPVTHAEAEEALRYFLDFRLATFGDYQDAMLAADPFMSHSLLAAAINIGLLEPLFVVQEAIRAYEQRLAPLAAVEGFIRQIIGWREYVRGIYLRMPYSYRERNDLQAYNDLPSFFWTGDTEMNCLRTTIRDVQQYGYSHHIQRLMILCNYATLAEIEPKQVVAWFNQVYIDAHDWVVVPNVIGMGLYADGGATTTKPYVASRAYIAKMSDYCLECLYNKDNCPFVSLYEQFWPKHRARFERHPRLSFHYDGER